MLVPMVGRGFLGHIQVSGSFFGQRFFFSRWIDREIELHSLEVLPEGFVKWPLVSGLDSVRFTFRDHIAFYCISKISRQAGSVRQSPFETCAPNLRLSK